MDVGDSPAAANLRLVRRAGVGAGRADHAGNAACVAGPAQRATVSAETAADRARRLLEGAPGPWSVQVEHPGPFPPWGAPLALIAATVAHEVTRAALDAVERERDEARAELAAAWEETGRPSGCNTLAGAVRWAFRGRYNRDEMSQILGRREGETTAEAARRVVAERDALQGHWCLACGGTGQGLGLHPCDACQGGAR